MISNICKYCSNAETNWIFKDKQNKIAFGSEIKNSQIKFIFQYGDWNNLKINWNGIILDMKFCPWCGRKLGEN